MFLSILLQNRALREIIGSLIEKVTGILRTFHNGKKNTSYIFYQILFGAQIKADELKERSEKHRKENKYPQNFICKT
jgi:hypothetical protein